MEALIHKLPNGAYEHLHDLLNALIRVHSQRIETYTQANGDKSTENTSVRDFFAQLTKESRAFRQALGRYLISQGGQIEAAVFASPRADSGLSHGLGEEAVLEWCEKREQAAVRMLEHALESQILPPDLRSMVQGQLEHLKNAQRVIKHFQASKHNNPSGRIGTNHISTSYQLNQNQS